MECPYCKNDLTHLETEENILKWHSCKKCHNNIWLDFEVSSNSDKYLDKYFWLKMRNLEEE